MSKNRTIKRMSILWMLPIIAVLMASCNTDGEYVEHNGTICHSYWTFSFGTQYHELPQVNPLTFKSIKNWLGHDNEHVYFKDKLIPGADPNTIKADKYPMCHDSHDYYYMGTPLKVNNVRTFAVIEQHEDDIWALDGKYAYYDTIRIEPRDLSTFKVQCWNCAVDSEHVYRYGKILPEADPATYVEEWKGFYSRDKNHIWYMGDLMEDIDAATFTVDDNGPHDKQGHIHNGKRISDEEWKQLSKEDRN